MEMYRLRFARGCACASSFLRFVLPLESLDGLIVSPALLRSTADAEVMAAVLREAQRPRYVLFVTLSSQRSAARATRYGQLNRALTLRGRR